MAIKFESFDMPKSTWKQTVSKKDKEKIAKQVKAADEKLQKKMIRIRRTEAEAWRRSHHKRK